MYAQFKNARADKSAFTQFKMTLVVAYALEM